MSHVLNLVADPSGRSLAENQVTAARWALATAGAEVAAADWLAPGRACDLPFEGLEPAAAEEEVRSALGGAPVDLACLAQEGRRKRLLVADMESTVIRNEMLDELADLAGLGERVAAITARAMNGEVDFAEALRERVALLAGRPAELLERAYERLELDPGARALVATMAHHGATTALVSGGFSFFTTRVRERLGFDLERANRLEIADGRLTGRVAEPILDCDAKLAVLRELCAELGIEPAAVLAVGDGANDLAMLRAAGLSVAYRAKPAVAAEARVRVEHGDLSTLLYLQGYREGEIVG